jgi:Ca2+-binding EF-hand superfamily protein
LYENIDLDRNGALDVFELQPLLTHFINQYESRHNVELDSDAKEKMKDDLFNEMDIDKSGTID